MAGYDVVSEIAGTVWEVRANVGEKVEVGDEIMIIESMKMEIPILAEESGVVEAILVRKGNTVAEGQSVASIQT